MVRRMPSCFPKNKTSSTNTTLVQNVILEESPGSIDDPKRVLVVMNALQEFSVNLLEWVLKNFTFKYSSSSITLLGIMSWLNIPLSAKTWSDIWSINLDLSSFLDKNDSKYLKVQRLIELCQKYGVVPEIRIEMGHPLRLLSCGANQQP